MLCACFCPILFQNNVNSLWCESNMNFERSLITLINQSVNMNTTGNFLLTRYKENQFYIHRVYIILFSHFVSSRPDSPTHFKLSFPDTLKTDWKGCTSEKARFFKHPINTSWIWNCAIVVQVYNMSPKYIKPGKYRHTLTTYTLVCIPCKSEPYQIRHCHAVLIRRQYI